MKSSMQPRCSIDEKLGVLDVVFLLYFPKKHLRCDDCSLDIEANVEEFVGFRFNRREEPKSFAIDLDDRLVEGDLLWFSITVGFEIGLLDPVVNGRLAPVDAKLLGRVETRSRTAV